MFGNQKSVFNYFLKQLFLVLMILVMMIFSYILFLDVSINRGFLTAANEPFNLMEGYKERVNKNEKIISFNIPDEVDYIIINTQDKEIISTNMKHGQVKKELQNIEKLDKKYLQLKDDQYTLYMPNNLRVQLSDPTLRHVIPNFEIISFLLGILLFFCVVIGIAKRIQNLIKNENSRLIAITSEIEKEEIPTHFPEKPLKEYESVYKALEHLSLALGNSVNENIKLQQEKEEQISFLIHDLKIPLTVVKGNTELLALKNQEKKDLESYNDIEESIKEIEDYIQLIIDLNLNHKEQKDNSVQSLNISDIIDKFKKPGAFSTNKIDVCAKVIAEKIIYVNTSDFYRALGNIIINAHERTPKHKKVKITIETEEKYLLITIEDFGNGFTEESLERGKKLFYTENKARHNKHYGLGLTFSTRIIESYGGVIEITNNQLNHGKVIVKIPLFDK